jgi:acetyl-CoA acetyltransferase
MIEGRHPFHDVAIVGAYNTQQAKSLDDHDSVTITMDAAIGALADAGLTFAEVDGVAGPLAGELIYQARIGPAWCIRAIGIGAVLEAAAGIAAGLATTVLIADGAAGLYTYREATAPWTRPANEFTAPYGMFTAAEYALTARRHMQTYGTRPEALATVAATIRNNGSDNPAAVYFGRGPFTAADVLASRMIADPFHLLDCAMTSEGGCGLLLTRADKAADTAKPPVFILGGGTDRFADPYTHPPTLDLGGRRRPDLTNGSVGRRAVEQCWATSGLGPTEVDVCEFYDPFSFEVIRQFEAFGFCLEGEGGDFILGGTIEPTGRFPVTTDGGTMAFGHCGSAQMIQRVARGVHQIRGECKSKQVPDAEVVLCTTSGSGSCATDIVLLGVERP